MHVPLPLFNDPVVVRAYDPAWPLLFQEERARLLARLPGVFSAVEHVGSTAVPGLDSKPILDLMAAARILPARAVRGLSAMGYACLGEFGVPGRTFFQKGLPRTHHLHVTAPDGEFWRKTLRFRDHLRSHPADARRYAALKRDLARRYPDRRQAYTAAKGPFIAALTAKSGRE